jgi:hypothetical protein
MMQLLGVTAGSVGLVFAVAPLGASGVAKIPIRRPPTTPPMKRRAVTSRASSKPSLYFSETAK